MNTGVSFGLIEKKLCLAVLLRNGVVALDLNGAEWVAVRGDPISQHAIISNERNR